MTEEFTQRTGLTVNAATVRKALRQAGVKRERGAVAVQRRTPEEEAAQQRYGYTEEHRRALEPEQCYASCLTQTEWELVADLFEPPGKRGRPPQYSRWEMVNACCYVVRNGCSWRMLPREFPPWENVYRTFRRWAAAGKFERMHDRLRDLWRSREERAPEPTAAVLDAQSTRSSPQGGSSGYDAGKKVKGRKRNLVVDTLGLLLMVSVVPANVQDRDGADQVLQDATAKYPSLAKLYVDAGYSGACAAHIQQEYHLDVEVVRHPANRNVGRLGQSRPRGAVSGAGGQQGIRRAAETMDRGTHPCMVRTVPTLDHASRSLTGSVSSLGMACWRTHARPQTRYDLIMSTPSQRVYTN